MAAELLQLLELVKSFDDQASAQSAMSQHAQFINRHEETLTEYAGYLRQHAGILDQHTATIQQQAKDLRILRAERDGDAWLMHAQFGILLGVIVVITAASIAWAHSLQKQIRRMEALIGRSPEDVTPETAPTARR